MSDSLIAFQPAIEEPSKKTPSFNIPSSTIVESIVKCCNFPLGSVNLKSMYSISLSFISFRTLLALIISPVKYCYALLSIKYYNFNANNIDNTYAFITYI